MSNQGSALRGKKWYSLKALAHFKKDGKTEDWINSQPGIMEDIQAYAATLPKPAKTKKGDK